MHELSLSAAIVDTVERHAEGRRVTAVNMTVGALRQVVPDSLEFHFELVARGTVCEGAQLRQELVPARVACRGCQAEWDLEEPVFVCGSCGEVGEVVGGEEFMVDSIEVEEEAACTAPR